MDVPGTYETFEAKTLEQRLVEGPGSRELSDEVLLAMGATEVRNPASRDGGGPFYPKRMKLPNGSIIWWINAPHVSCSVDDALAMVPEGWEPYMAEWGSNLVEIEIWDQVQWAKGRAKGKNPLCRAICLAILQC